MKKFLLILIALIICSIANAKIPKHEFNLTGIYGTLGAISFSDGNSSTMLSTDYSYGFNDNIQLNGRLILQDSLTVIGLGAKYNFNPKHFMHSYFARAYLQIVEGDTNIVIGGGKRFRISKHVAYTPEAFVTIGDSTVISLFPIAFNFAANKLEFR